MLPKGMKIIKQADLPKIKGAAPARVALYRQGSVAGGPRAVYGTCLIIREAGKDAARYLRQAKNYSQAVEHYRDRRLGRP